MSLLPSNPASLSAPFRPHAAGCGGPVTSSAPRLSALPFSLFPLDVTLFPCCPPTLAAPSPLPLSLSASHCRFVLLRDPNKPALHLYAVAPDAFDHEDLEGADAMLGGGEDIWGGDGGATA